MFTLVAKILGESRKRTRMGDEDHVLAKLVDYILSRPPLSMIAAAAVKAEVDRIYGYEKYTLDEVASELEGRLYNSTYLGCAVSAILEAVEVGDAERTHVAGNYLDAVVSYLRGAMPRKTYRYWGTEAEPSHVVEAAAYLAQRKEFDRLEKRDYLKGILSFINDSSVQAKKSLLQAFVCRINEEYRERKAMEGKLTKLLSKENLITDTWAELLKEGGVRKAERKPEDERQKRQLIANLAALVDAEGNESSAGPLWRLSCLEGDDLTRLFLDFPLFVFTRRTLSNRTLLYYDAAKVMCEERNVQFPSIINAFITKLDQLEEDEHKSPYLDEPKVKALCRLAIDIGEDHNTELLTLVRKAISLKGVETETRLGLFKFLYRNSENAEQRKSVLAAASRFKSGKIRDWVVDERKPMKPEEEQRG